MSDTECEPLEGNADFYGLGIRIGFYLQWITTYLNFLFKLEPACMLYTTNSVFVFALAIALVVAYVEGSPPIEIHLMLHISLGFFMTSLSTMRIRHWFQDPRLIDEFVGRLAGMWQRYPGLSWSGVL
ncbi:unnamed protein product [Clonostachys solani]|uniref:Uncharacterized protein n=1 Tax=Clonostachys solani TaxID=160281 RepID=A0A9P0EFG4_9HYPO|nr:unnamed protein product [Clonostachys solani]